MKHSLAALRGCHEHPDCFVFARPAWETIAEQTLPRIRPLMTAHGSRIMAKAEEDLALQPGTGRPGRKEGTKELVISCTPYLVPYRVQDNCLKILRVLHRAVQWP